MTAASPQRARAKRTTRGAIEVCGGIEAVAATEGTRGKSQVGRWHSLDEADLPPIDCCAIMDAIAVAEGREPPFATFLAHEVGRVLVDPPSEAPTRAGLNARMAAIVTASGALQADYLDAVAVDGISPTERAGDARAGRAGSIRIGGVQRRARQGSRSMIAMPNVDDFNASYSNRNGGEVLVTWGSLRMTLSAAMAKSMHDKFGRALSVPVKAAEMAAMAARARARADRRP